MAWINPDGIDGSTCFGSADPCVEAAGGEGGRVDECPPLTCVPDTLEATR